MLPPTAQATGDLDTSAACVRRVLGEQAAVGVLLGGALSAAGFARVWLTSGSGPGSTAVALSCLGIVVSSCLLGSALPFGLARAGVDPANAGTSIQARAARLARGGRGGAGSGRMWAELGHATLLAAAGRHAPEHPTKQPS